MSPQRTTWDEAHPGTGGEKKERREGPHYILKSPPPWLMRFSSFLSEVLSLFQVTWKFTFKSDYPVIIQRVTPFMFLDERPLPSSLLHKTSYNLFIVPSISCHSYTAALRSPSFHREGSDR